MASHQTAAAPAPAPRPLPTKFDLTKVVKGRVEAPLRVLLAGTEGIGKSTWANDMPNPIFFAVEEGANELDAARMPLPEGVTEWTWPLVMDAIQALIDGDHAYESLVIDTVDALEPLVWDFVCRKNDKANIEAFGFGKGYVAALGEWRAFLSALERLRKKRGMHLGLVAHTWIKSFKNPTGDDYDRYQLKLNDKAAGLLKEWCDDVLFAHWETFAVKGENGKAKGVSSGARIVSTTRTAAWDAKNRHGLPESLPLDFDAFMQAVSAGRPLEPAALRARIEANLAGADEDTKKKVRATVAKVGDDARQLARIDNKLAAMTAPAGE